ncbi:MAG: guanylate kinase [Planctomycetota bacterium]|nr:guanylate kinase [Planctomycetota bacterium]
MSHRRLPTDTDDGLLLIISGPSGVGKTTITRGVERSIPDAVFSVSWTTRAPTPADVEGVDYHFVSDDAFEQMRREDGFLESAGVYGKKYGTPRAWVFEQLARGRVVILEIDVQGAIQVKQRVADAFAVFILPPSEDVLLSRLRERKREGEEQIQKRFAAARREIAQARESGVYNVFVVNERLEEAIGLCLRHVDEARAARRAGGPSAGHSPA